MKTLRALLISTLVLAGANSLFSQGGVSNSLGITGLENGVVADARSRAMGWSSIANANNASAVFNNPAMLIRLEHYEIRAGGISSSSTYSQQQQWYPDKVYATLSLLLEDRLIGIPDTGTNQIPLERKYDDIGPNWEKKKSRYRPSSIVGVAPVGLFGMKTVIGAGYAEMINLDHYFQNNSAMDPYIGSFRPEPYPRPALGDTVKVRWYQFSRDREGSVYGIVPAASVQLFDKMSMGVSVAILDGTSDDVENRRERGLFRFATSSTGNFNVYYVDSVYYRQTTQGTSTYSGMQTTLGFMYDGGEYTLGVIVKPSYTITRKYSGTITTDTASGSIVQQYSGSDKIVLPLTYAFGGSFSLSERMRLAVDYVVCNNVNAEYSSNAGSAVKPWLGNAMFRLGLEVDVMDELSIQCGYRENTQVFAGEGAPLVDDPVRGYGITGGIGLNVGMISVNAAYEYTSVQFEDKWISNINYNKRYDHTIVAETSVRF